MLNKVQFTDVKAIKMFKSFHEFVFQIKDISHKLELNELSKSVYHLVANINEMLNSPP